MKRTSSGCRRTSIPPSGRRSLLMIAFLWYLYLRLYYYNRLAFCSGSPAPRKEPPAKIFRRQMPVSFENDNDIIRYVLEKIISFARNNQYIFLAHSIWWISSIFGLQKELIIHIDILKTQADIVSQRILSPEVKNTSVPKVSAMPWDTQEHSRPIIEASHIHPERIWQVNTYNDISDLDLCKSGIDRQSQIVEEAKQFVRVSQKERKAFNKKKQDLLWCTRSGKFIVKPITTKQRNYLTSIPKENISAYLADRK